MQEIYAIINQKGGVGKTTTAVNLAAWAAVDGKRVLLVDADPQGNATSGLGVDRRALQRCLYDVLTSDITGGPPFTIKDATTKTCVDGLDVVPATINLAGADMTLASAIARDTRLRHALDPVRKSYDIIIIDTAPSLGILTVNALAAAQKALIPIQCEYYALEGLSQLMKVINLVQSQINPALQIGGMVLTMYDSRTNLSIEVAEDVRSTFHGRVYETLIPRNIRLAEAPGHGQPAAVYDPHSVGAKRYWMLYKEVFGNA
ncbi:MAG: AAA family ATPase [Armatimonadetes bacterium]|nr:AAA family ATPase [Armatimonadota bacterium]